MNAKTPPPCEEKGRILAGVYMALNHSLHSIGTRCSSALIIAGSYLAVAASFLTQRQGLSTFEKSLAVLQQPSVLVGIVALAFMLWAQVAVVRVEKDMFSQLMATSDQAATVEAIRYADDDTCYTELAKNAILVASLLRRRALFFNIGLASFVLSVCLNVVGL